MKGNGDGKAKSEVIAKRKCAVLDKVTLLEKGIKILDFNRFMWM
jgi:hypothetical protein